MVANWFYEAVRAGETEPRRICSAVYRELSRKLARYGDRDGTDYGETLAALAAAPAEAMEFALHILARERQSPEEKRARKEAEAEAGRREWMRRQPPTEKQIAVLRERLGYGGEIENRLHASELIEQLKDW